MIYHNVIFPLHNINNTNIYIYTSYVVAPSCIYIEYILFVLCTESPNTRLILLPGIYFIKKVLFFISYFCFIKMFSILFY